MPLADWPVAKHPLYFCWEWRGRLDKDGYGRLDRQLAHRAVYEAEKGPIPEGLTLEHRCRNRVCVNPAHLKPVSHHEQQLMKNPKVRARWKVLDCGHSFERHGRMTPQGGKVCRLCS